MNIDNKFFVVCAYFLELIFLPFLFLSGYYLFFVFVHLLSIFIFVRYKLSSVTESKKPFYFFVLLLLVFFPVFGVIFTLFTSNKKINQKIIDRLNIFDENGFEEEKALDIYKTYISSPILPQIKESLDFDTFFNILQNGERESKLKVIAKLSTMQADRNSIELIKKTLNSEYHDIKLYSAAALMKIEDSIFKKINDAKAEMAYDFNIKNLKKLIAMYEFYITTGLVNNKQILDKYLNEIISLYKRIDDEHKDMDFYKGLIKNYILMNEYKIASEILSEAKVKFENLENSENKETLVFLEVEIKFYENNYKFISENLKKNKDIFKKEKENLGVYEIWV
jgi:hypothetical protein